jgi:putative phosphoesterase
MIERTRLALEVFEREAAEAIFHCGDVGGLDVLQLFAGKVFWFVWGNTDRVDASWRRALEVWGMAWPDSSPLRLELAGRRIVVAHGHERDFRQVLRDPQADYLFYGHSHARAMLQMAGCTVVNPGAIQRTSLATVAIVDLASGQVRHVDLHGQPVSADG